MEVIQYVAEKYGKKHVAQIITFGTLSARSVARNVARVFGFSNEEMAYLSKEIPNRHRITLEEAVAESKRLTGLDCNGSDCEVNGLMLPNLRRTSSKCIHTCCWCCSITRIHLLKLFRFKAVEKEFTYPMANG